MSVRVAVRCRPFNQREVELGSKCVVSMSGNSTILNIPTDFATRGDRSATRQFTFDHSFWSHDPSDPEFSTQQQVYDCIGSQVLEDAFDGYHSCVFAYGQTGAGKSYTMMGGHGGHDDRGIIPRLCEELFSRIKTLEGEKDDGWTAKVEVSYMEIYLEKVKDLLGNNVNHKLRVREHSSTGPYVEDLTKHAVSDFTMVKNLMDAGNKMRTVKATAMNDVSSRSHAIFQIVFTQTQINKTEKEVVKTERVSKISLVDLAGSERSGQINAGRSERMKEGSVINKSLSTLGKVISTLADSGASGKKPAHVPYRDSVLTWLLKESIGGNSKTIMMAAISPAGTNFEETLSTLRYANQAKKIVNKAVVNEDATATMVRKLNEEIEELKQQLEKARIKREEERDAERSDSRASAASDIDWLYEAEVLQQLEESEKLMMEMTITWEEKLERTLAMQAQRGDELRAHGIVLADDNDDASLLGVMPPAYIPYLINLSHNPLQQGCLVYYLKEGETAVKRRDSCDSDVEDTNGARSIGLVGSNILPQHCVFRCLDDGNDHPYVSIIPKEGAEVMVNKKPIHQEVQLHSGDILDIGSKNSFRFDNPSETRQATNSSPSSAGHRSRSVSPAVSLRVDRLRQLEEEEELKLLAEEARKMAIFPYNSEDEDVLLGALVTNAKPRMLDFKLMPAYGVYLIVRYCQAEYGNLATNGLLLKIATLVKISLYNARTTGDVASLAFWLSNGAELLMVLRSDDSLASCQAAEAQLLLTDAVQEAFTTLLVTIKDRVNPGLPAFLKETAGTFSQMANGGESPPRRVSGSKELFDVRYVIESLDALNKLLVSALVSESIVQQLFSHLFYYMGCQLFNDFIENKEYFKWDKGLSIRFNLVQLSEWGERHGFDVDNYLVHITEASQLLQTNKSSLAHLDFICESCSHLNSLQLEHILRSYKPSADEEKVPATLVDCLKARAMNHADNVAKEDETCGYRLKLTRNPDFVLPFRLSGQFHMNSGLLDLQLIHSVRDYLTSIDVNELRDIGAPPLTPPLSRRNRCRVNAEQWASLHHFNNDANPKRKSLGGRITAFFGF